jgi:GT2 family glycosyltransferase/glycosyltransferase involved in cell wall biosynthesis/SAM-dependent methyltransferase
MLPSVSERPKISFVFAVHDPEYGGGLLASTQRHLDALIELTNRYRLLSEIVIVEWNPRQDRARFRESLRWPDYLGSVCLRFIEVPAEIHHRLPNADRIPIFEYIAKNAGLRRARGQFLLATNPDLCYSPALMRWLARTSLSPGTFYRVDRRDLSEEIPGDLSLPRQLRFCSRHVSRVHALFGSYRLADVDGCRRLRDEYDLCMHDGADPTRWTDTPDARLIRPADGLHRNAAGDFFLMERGWWHRLRGYPELYTHAHIDAILCWVASSAGMVQEILPSRCRLYHQAHHRAAHVDFPQTDWGPWYQRYEQTLREGPSRQGSPMVVNLPDWGLGNEVLPEWQASPRLVQVQAITSEGRSENSLDVEEGAQRTSGSKPSGAEASLAATRSDLQRAQAWLEVSVQEQAALRAALRKAQRDHKAERTAAEQLQLECSRHESEVAALRSELEAIRGSTIWRASAPLRLAAGKLPSSLRPVARTGLRAVYWVLTPWNTAKRLRFLRERYGQEPAVAPLNTPPVDSRTDAPSSKVPEIDFGSPGPELSPVPASAVARLSIAYVSGEPDTPGHQYRVARYVAAAQANDCSVLWMRGDELPERMGELFHADVLIIWRMKWNDHVGTAVEMMRLRRKRVVFDVDDLMVDPDLAQIEIIDGIRSQFLTEDVVRASYAAIRDTMLSADVCFATTEELALHMRRRGKVVYVLPNGFDYDTHNLSRRAARRWRGERPDRLIRLGYAGGSRTHQRDLGVAIDAIARLLREIPECRLVLYRTADGRRPVVDIEEYPALRDLADRIEWRALRPLAELPEEIARFDVNLAPLELGNPFCEAKSELKFFDAALVGVATIASPTGPYRRVIAHGKTGFLAASGDDWYVYLRMLVEDSALRDRVGRAAYLEALARFGPLARTARFGRVVAALGGGAPAATAFAIDVQLSSRRAVRPEVFPYETVFEHDALGNAGVTVVVPLHNYEGYVLEALDSVYEQSVGSLDLIVVDDCSTDRSLEVAVAWAERKAARFNRIVVVKNRSNYGLAHSRNAGFDAAETPYVLPLDADNKLLPHCCDRLLNAIRSSGVGFVYGTIQRFGDETSFVSQWPYEAQRLVGGNYIDAMALVSKEAWVMVGGYHQIQIAGVEDYDFWCRIAEHGLRGAWSGDVVALYRVHQSSMLRTHTNVNRNHRELLDIMASRHPWLALVDRERFRDVPAHSTRLTQPDKLTRLHSLLPILRCPETGQKLAFDETGTMLASIDGLRRWPIVEGRPVLSGQSDPEIRPLDHTSNVLSDGALELIRETKGLVLNLSAGASLEKFDHVVEVEFSIFRHTDVVADAHRMPFDDDVFEAVVVMNAFEHYRDPVRVASELRRIMKPGGRILIRTAFLQPLHERPWHFFNCTRYGLEEWLKGFETDKLHVSDNFSPAYSVAWLASEAESALRQDISAASADAFADSRMGQFAEMWRHESKRTGPLWENFCRLGQKSQEVTAAGFEFWGRKPVRSSPAAK